MHQVLPGGTGSRKPRKPARDAPARVAASVAAATRLEDVLEAAAEEALAVSGASSLAISRFDRQTGSIQTLINVGEVGPREERFPTEEFYAMSDWPQVRELIENQRPYTNDIRTEDCDPAAAGLLKRSGQTSDIGVAIVVGDEVWGEIRAARTAAQRPFAAEDALLLADVASQIAVAIERAELLSEMSRLAYEDTLTGLPNRRAFDARLAQSLDTTATDSDVVSLLLCDLDGLKEINDERGHEAGDRALQDVAKALTSASGHEGKIFLARLAGDEFAALIEGADLVSALKLGARALEELQRTTSSSVSISSGAAMTHPQREEDGPSDLLRNADAALYVAKRLGGGRVCSAGEDGGSRQPEIDLHGSRRAQAPRSVSSTLNSLIAALDSRLAQAPLLDRLEAVAMGFARLGDFAYWSISRLAPGNEVLVDVSAGDNRAHDAGPVRVTVGNETYRLADFPVTQRVVLQGAGFFFIDRSDEHADRAERDLLHELGFQSVVGAVAATAEDAYLMELYGDEQTVAPWKLATSLRLAAQAAVPPQRPLG